MPELPEEKIKPHPARLARSSLTGGSPNRASLSPAGRRRRAPEAYAELSVTSNFTFLTGASHPEEMVERAQHLGHAAVSITDTNTLAGIVRGHVAAKEAGLPFIVGCRLRFKEVDPSGPAVLVYPTSRDAYARLCRMLTIGKRRATKGQCELTLDDLIEHEDSLLALVEPGLRADDQLAKILRDLRQVFVDDRLSLGVSWRYGPDDAARVRALERLGAEMRTPLAAINEVHYHAPERRMLQDVLVCIRGGCTIEEAGLRLAANAERHLKTGPEMARLLSACPGATTRTIDIAQRATAFSLDELKYEYPVESCPAGSTPMEHLAALTAAGAAKKYPGGVPDKVRLALQHELTLIAELGYEAYFLTCHDIVSFAINERILYQGRGGAANSAVCYCLGITAVDPARFSLLFERFISRERGEPPDIDIDFEHGRREEVIQYLYRKYGRDRAALTAEVITYRGRSAIRDVGKAMGLSLDAVDTLAKQLSGWGEGASEARAREAGLNPTDPTIRRVLGLASELAGFPRHLSQHVGGFVITRGPLSDLVPVENAAMADRTVIEWDKDDIDAMGMLKVDVLGLGMLTCLRKCLTLLNPDSKSASLAVDGGEHAGPVRPGSIGTIPLEDPGVYDMLCRADTLGVFQVESRAQMSMLPRLRPREFYDLVVEVAIVRPGPIQGGMVHPYLKRRANPESVNYPNAAIEDVLGRTLGVPIFQEQAMRLAIVAGGFTADEADALRRAMAAWKRKGDRIARFGERLIAGMKQRGYSADFAERCFEQIKGFSEYGFPESHAASFALLVYRSAWLKRYHPAAFAAALINSQPMGFYQPAQIVRDAREHGVDVRPVDVNVSNWDCTLEWEETEQSGPDTGWRSPRPSDWGRDGPALRLGMRLVKGLGEEDSCKIAEAVKRAGPFRSVTALWRASGCSARTLRRLARADAFGSMGLDRQSAIWALQPLSDERLPLLDQIVEREIGNSQHAEHEGSGFLPRIRPGRLVLQDYDAIGLSLKDHPLSFIRERLCRTGVTAARSLADEALCPGGKEIAVAGVVLVRQRPGTASGVVFVTLEDETGISNLVIWSSTFEQYRKVIRLSTVLLARGRIERQGEVVHIHARRLESLDDWIPGLGASSRDFH